MNWWPKECEAGDMIRIQLGPIFHYGIFVSEEEVIQFGLPPAGGVRKLSDSSIKVLASDINAFSLGRIVEVGVLDRKEKRAARSREQIVEIARSRIGEGGYNLLHNNCEHFANECVFGKKISRQEDEVRNKWNNRPIVDVYVSQIPESLEISSVFPQEREKQILEASHERVKAERFWAWKTLEYAAARTFSFSMEELAPRLLQNGKWVSDRCYFSISHCDGLVAVAISNQPVGIDMENLSSFEQKFSDKNRLETFCKKMLAPFEKLASEKSQLEEAAKKWTQKEALFKSMENAKVFVPKKIKVKKEKVISKFDEMNGVKYVMSVCTPVADSMRFYTFSEENLK